VVAVAEGADDASGYPVACLRRLLKLPSVATNTKPCRRPTVSRKLLRGDVGTPVATSLKSAVTRTACTLVFSLDNRVRLAKQRRYWLSGSGIRHLQIDRSDSSNSERILALTETTWCHAQTAGSQRRKSEWAGCTGINVMRCEHAITSIPLL